MNKYFIIILVLFFSIQINSQEIKKYSWDQNPVFKEIPEKYKDQPAIVLLDKRWIHTRVGYYAFATFIMNHVAIKINSRDEINKYNKVAANNNGITRDTRDFHARVIKPNGEIKPIPQESIVQREIDKIQSIVFEGVEAGDILEYYFILKELPNNYNVEVFQREIPVLDAKLIATGNGVYYNFFESPEFARTGNRSKEVYQASDIFPYKEEVNSRFVHNIVKIICLADTSIPTSKSWKIFLPTVFRKPSFIHFKKNKARNFIENLKVNDLSLEEKLTKLDLHIKENFEFIEYGEKAKKVTDLNDGSLKLNMRDIFHLYGFALQEFNIHYLVVSGLERYYGDIDPLIRKPGLPHSMMYFIPETNKFLSPTEKYLPYGYPAYEFQWTRGVSFNPNGRSKRINDFQFPVAPSDFTVISTENTIQLSEDLSQMFLEKKYASTGYSAHKERYFIKYTKKNKEEKELKDVLESIVMNGSDVKIKDYKISNIEFTNNHTNTPFLIETNLEINEPFIENAGNLVLVNIGKVIGKQSNLYQETERVHDIDMKYAKKYHHTIKFDIPDNYEIESISDLNFSENMFNDELTNCSFQSKAKLENNTIIIEVNEVYKGITYPKDKYDEYRKVINAAADFSKASVILKPKK